MLIVTAVMLQAQQIEGIEMHTLHCMNINKLKVHSHKWWLTSGIRSGFMCTHICIHITDWKGIVSKDRWGILDREGVLEIVIQCDAKG